MAGKDNPKTGGREAGTPNKIQSKTKDFLKQLVDDNQERITEELAKLKGKDFLIALNNFLEYTEPKLSRVEVKAEIEDVTNKPFDINFSDDESKD